MMNVLSPNGEVLCAEACGNEVVRSVNNSSNKSAQAHAVRDLRRADVGFTGLHAYVQLLGENHTPSYICYHQHPTEDGSTRRQHKCLSFSRDGTTSCPPVFGANVRRTVLLL